MWKLKGGRHDADHGVVLIVERDALIDDVAVSSETSLPETVAQHHDSILLLGRSEHAPGGRLRFEHRKEIRRNVSAANPFRLRSARHVEAVIRVRSDGVEDLCLLRVVVVLGSLRAQAFDIERAVVAPDHVQAIRVWKGQRSQQDSVDHAEDRRARADSQRERDHNDRRKAGLFP